MFKKFKHCCQIQKPSSIILDLLHYLPHVQKIQTLLPNPKTLFHLPIFDGTEANEYESKVGFFLEIYFWASPLKLTEGTIEIHVKLSAVTEIVQSAQEQRAKELTMRGKNYEICHSYRQTGHWLNDCPTKRFCPWCGQEIVQLFEAERMTKNRGRLFYSCNQLNCLFFEWLDLSSKNVREVKKCVVQEADDLSRLLKMCAGILHEDNVEKDVIRIRKNNPSSNKKEKGKLPMEE